MNIQPYQLITFLTYAALFYIVCKIKKTKIRIFILMIIFILFYLNPFRLKQEGISRIDRNSVKFHNIPREEVKQKTFEEKQTIEMKKLKLQSKGLKDEIYN